MAAPEFRSILIYHASTNARRKRPAIKSAYSENKKVNAKIWRALREALEGLSSLPAPRDIAAFVSGYGQASRVVDAKGETAAIWLMEFMDEWHKAKADRDGDVHARNGGGSVAQEQEQSPAL